MSNVLFDHGPNGKFIRSGECTRCGACCMGNPFTGQANVPCPLLTISNGQFACSDREHPYYLKGCFEWPTHPGQIVDKPDCTYRFERVDGN